MGVSNTETEKYNKCVEDIGVLMQKTVRIFQRFEREQIKKYGFTNSQCYVMIELLKNRSLTMNEMSEKMGLDMSTITRVIDNLVRDGYILRKRSEDDKRIVEAHLTDKGTEVAEKLSGGIAEYYKSVISNLPKGHVREVMGSVELLLDAVEKSK